MSVTGLIQGLNAFHSDYFTENRELFERLSNGQTPEVLFITCSDSRIDPCLITQSQPGELFVMRNVGNIIPSYGAASGAEAAGVEYAVAGVGVRDIIVCGHSHCGAMKGLLQIGNLSEQMPLVYDWLKRHGEATRRLVLDNYANVEPERLLKIAIEQNVLTQIENLETYPVIRSTLHSGQMNLHAWMYEIETGKVFAYDAGLRQFTLLKQRSFPVPDPLITTISE
ncbi:carbonic anhydrase [Oculatella sp. FACHB-28]|uniref:carbonic anhydrase n=1 Tax=Cyanophyceae TaxID=3028117 RepID=UPI0016863F1E|nr:MULTISPECIES: carbonic anhydrase [Cyanophyceae]MBD1869491.1 carbonic anhydrase [Cyanobacteria bacterium FACHB-471]MBD1997213.1 carbonic anhydrase [Leptolyngbya sp. FACHB-541]MBD2057904.1 carbonic anhydrase [Oculatella sp. FACHB-28]